MNKRRDFLKTSLLFAGALGFGHKLQALPVPMPDKKHIDEEYWKMIRAQFPLSHEKIYLNNGTMGPSPYAVVNTVQQEMFDVDSQARYGGYEDKAVKALAHFLQVKESEISLMRNVTEGLNVACWGLNLKAGDEVIMCGHEHVGHAAPWLNRAKLHGLRIKILKLGLSADETVQNLKALINKKTKVISLPHIPCTVGIVLPVKAICQMARENQIFTLLDGAHPPGMLQVNIEDIGCDAYAGCCHKWMLGPKGTGFLFISERVRNQVQAYHVGAGFDTGWDMLTEPPGYQAYVDTGHRYYYGTQNAALWKGVVKAIDFQNEIGLENIEFRVKSLANYLQEHLLKLDPRIIMLTPTEAISKAAQVSFKIKDKEMSQLQSRCTEKKIITRYVPENNINCLRVSTHIYNNFKEIDAFLQEVDLFLRA